MCFFSDTTVPAILQRVLSASVTVDQEVVSKIGKGVLVLAAMAPGDTEKEAEALATKILKLKLWDDDSGGRVRGLSLYTPPIWIHTYRLPNLTLQNEVEKKCARYRRGGSLWYGRAT